MQARRIKCKLFMSIMKNNFLRCFVLLWLFFAAMALQAQDAEQAILLKKAFRQNSQEKLELFFQNWAKEVIPSDTAAANPYVAEAFKLFPVFYQPTTMPMYDTNDYRNSAYFIVQSTLNEIRITDEIPYTEEELDTFAVKYIHENYPKNEWNSLIRMNKKQNVFKPLLYDPFFYRRSSDLVDSALSFRPPLVIKDRGIIYLTDDYKLLLDDFIGIRNPIFQKRTIRNRAVYKRCVRRWQFIEEKAHIINYHYLSFLYETHPVANAIIFDKAMQRAIVHYRANHSGGYVLLVKINGEWSVVRAEQTWNWD